MCALQTKTKTQNLTQSKNQSHVTSTAGDSRKPFSALKAVEIAVLLVADGVLADEGR